MTSSVSLFVAALAVALVGASPQYSQVPYNPNAPIPGVQTYPPQPPSQYQQSQPQYQQSQPQYQQSQPQYSLQFPSQLGSSPQPNTFGIAPLLGYLAQFWQNLPFLRPPGTAPGVYNPQAQIFPFPQAQQQPVVSPPGYPNIPPPAPLTTGEASQGIMADSSGAARPAASAPMPSYLAPNRFPLPNNASPGPVPTSQNTPPAPSSQTPPQALLVPPPAPAPAPEPVPSPVEQPPPIAPELAGTPADNPEEPEEKSP